MRRLLGPLTFVVVVLGWPSGASAAGWTCEASALRALVLTSPPVEPAPANRGAGDCKADAATGGVLPALPLGLSASVLEAQTRLDGPPAAPQQQTAHAEAGVGSIGVAALPELPIPLPDPDFGDLDAVEVPGAGTVDLRPALEALIQPRTLPNVELLRVTAARSQASAACVSGVPRLSGRSTIASVAVNGRELGLDGATTEIVRLVDSQEIDPSDIDVSKIVAPPGVDLSALRAAIQPVLDALPGVEVPATLARIRLTPNQREETGTRLTQRALLAQITIAGRRFLDMTVGEATVGVGDVSCGGVADLALQCTSRRLVLIDVYRQRGRVRLLGAAHRRYVGRRVRIRFTATGRTVARPRVRGDGTFRATAELPPRKIRETNRARYQASIRRSAGRAASRREKSMRLKLVRRMLVTRMRLRGNRVVIGGRVIRPLARPVRTIVVKRRLSCGRWRVVRRFKPDRDGGFRVRLRGPDEGQAAVYRMQTRVKLYSWYPKLYPTFTLPRYVDLG